MGRQQSERATVCRLSLTARRRAPVAQEFEPVAQVNGGVTFANFQ